MADVGGQPGNDNAKRSKIWTDAIKRAIARRYGNLPDGLDKLADDFIKAVAEGGIPEKEMMGNRLEGKPAQTITGDDENPLTIQVIERVIVRE